MLDTTSIALDLFKGAMEYILLELKYIDESDLTKAEKNIKRYCNETLKMIEKLRGN